MKNKKAYILLFLTLILFLSLSSVSATNFTDNEYMYVNDFDEDINNYTSLNQYDNILESNNENLLSNPESRSDSITVTPENFNNYFESDGTIKQDIASNSLIFSGNFTNMDFNTITINKENMNIKGDNANFTEISFFLEKSNIILSDINLILSNDMQENDGAAILIFDDNVKINNVFINYTVPDGFDTYGIYVEGSEDKILKNITITNNTIFFRSNQSNSEYYNNALRFDFVEESLVKNNNFTSEIPFRAIDYSHGWMYMSMDTISPIRFEDCKKVEFSDNYVNTTPSDLGPSYPTIQSLMIYKTEELIIKNNYFSMIDELSTDGKDNYLYAINIISSDKLVVDNNTFNLSTKGGKVGAGTSYAIQIAGPSYINITNNNITTVSNGPNLGIYSENFEGEVYLNISSNFINVTGLAGKNTNYALVSGLELQDTYDRVYNNTIYVYNKGEYDENNYIFGISYAQMSYDGHNFDIQNNTIFTEGHYGIYLLSAENSNVTNNLIVSNDLVGDEAVMINSGSGNTVENNQPNFIVTNETFFYYFDSNGKLLDYIPDGATLDFRGPFNGITYQIDINKPINMVSTTNNALFNKIGTFNITNGGSYTNMSNISLFNTQFFIKNAHYVTVDHVNVTVKGERIGRGVGVVSVRENSTYVVVKNSHFHTEDNGGSSTLVFTYANYCTFDNNTVKGVGNVGNLMYINFYNVDIPEGAVVNAYNNITNNKIKGPLTSSIFCYAIAVSGNDNLIANNTIDYSGNGIVSAWGASPSVLMEHNFYMNNTLTGGCGLSPLKNSIVENNTVEGKTTIKEGSNVSGNTFNEVSVKGSNSIIENNTINGVVSILAASTNTNLINNTIKNKVSVKSDNNIIKDNNITTSSAYAVELGSKTGNKVTDNYLISDNHYGDNAVQSSNIEDNVIKNNAPFRTNIDIEIIGNYDKDVIININASSLNSTDTEVILYINGEEEANITLINGTASHSLYGLTDDVYNITVKYPGDLMHVAGEKTVLLTNTVMDLSTDEFIFVDDDAIIKATLSDGSTGNVIFTIDDIVQSSEIVNGIAEANFNNLAAGSYIVKAEYVGSETFLPVSATTSFTVKKHYSNLEVFAIDLFVGEDTEIIASLPVDASGDVVFTIGDLTQTVAISDGQATASFTGLSDGNYIVKAYYAGDNKYLKSNAVDSFNVNKFKSGIIILTNDIFVGEDAEIIASLPVDASGDVVFTIGDLTQTVAISDGQASASFTGLSAGNYIVKASYVGDNKYLASKASDLFTVIKIKPKMNIDVNDIFVGEDAIINANLPSDAIGSVVFTVGDLTQTVAISDGQASATFSGLSAGNYNVKAEYDGDNKYFEKSAISVFNVAKVQPSLDIIVEDIVYGEDAEIIATLADDASGNVIFTVNNKVYAAEIINGQAKITLPNLNSGLYEVSAIYKGDNKYLFDSAFEGFNVEKLNSKIKVAADDIVFNDLAVINAILPDDATGEVRFIVNDIVKISEIINGQATVTYEELNPGEYQVNAVYSGNIKYQSSENTTNFNVNKAELNIFITANDIIVGEDAIINIVTNPSISDIIAVKINNEEYNVNIINSKGVLTVKNLTAGNYIVDALYDGNDNYLASESNAQFNVGKSNVDVQTEASVNGNNVSVLVGLSPVSEGNLSIIINNNTITADIVNGTARFDLNNLNPGEYTVKLIYPGNDNYNSFEKEFTFEIKDNKNVTLIAEDITMYYQDGTRLIVKLLDYKGNPIGNELIFITLNGIKYNRTTNEEGIASMAINLDVGEYLTNITYAGSDLYEEASTNNKLNVLTTIIGEDLTKFYRNESQYFAKFLDKEGNPLKNTVVTFNINGVFYNRTTNDEGIAKLSINLDPREYIITAFNPVTNQKHSNKIKVLSRIITSDLTKFYRNGTQFYAKLLDNEGKPLAGKELTFNINGVFYTRTTNNEGIAKLSINLDPREYIITTIDKETGLQVSNKITVLPRLSGEDITMKVRDGTQYKVKLVDDKGKGIANKNIKMNINGVFYNKMTDNNGVAKLSINLDPNTYIITAYYEKLVASNTIVVN